MIKETVLDGVLIDDSAELTMGELSRACGRPAEWLLALVEEGVIEPLGAEQARWRFRGACLRRVRIVQHLQTDLGVNLAGAALALELLEEVEVLRARMAVGEGDADDGV